MDGNDSIKNYCRICASNPPDVRNIFEVVYKDKPLSDILGQCLHCTIHRTEYFPDYICSQCCADLIKMHKFIANYEKNAKWFISRYEALNDARIIKTVCPKEFGKTSDISVEPNHQIFVESVINAVPIQDQTPNPLEVKEELDHDYELEMDDLPLSPNASTFMIQEPNEGNYNNVQENLATPHCDGFNEATVRKAARNNEMIRLGSRSEIYQCSVCPKQFSQRYILRNHENLHTGKRTFKCYFCNENFRRSDYRVNHIRKVHPEVTFECFVCKTIVNTFYDLGLHMQDDRHDNLPEINLNLWTEVYCKNNGIGDKTDSRLHECSICSNRFTSLDNLKKHINMHTRTKGYKCYFCDDKFWRSDYRVKHIRKMHPDVVFECSTCMLIFNTYNEMRLHMLQTDHSTSSQNEVNPAVEVPLKWKQNHPKIETGKYQCSMCAKQFSQLYRLRKHENLHTGKITFECYFCDEIFRRSDYRVKHIRKVHPEVLFECFVCKITVNTLKELRSHMQEHNNGHHNTGHFENLHTRPKHICEVCGMSFSMKYRLIDHQLKHTDERTFKCTHQDCHKAFKRKCELQAHLKIHEGKIDYFCKCGKGFVLAKQLRDHRVIHSEQHESVASHQCPFCPKIFTKKVSLKRHIKRHGGKLYKCKYCELMLTSSAGRNKHERNIHEAPRSYECFDCKRVFQYRDLLQHMKIHSSNDRVIFECEICSKPFWNEHRFINHKRKHNERVFNCEYCNESFEKRFELHSHVREIHAEKMEQYRCEQCSKRFPLESTLKSHIYKFHTKKKPENHLCTECGRTFAAPCLLKAHLQRHSDERPISCSHCPNKFKNKLQLKKHMAVHSLERNFICQVMIDGERVCGKKFHTACALGAHKRTHDPSNRTFACLTCPAKFRKKDKLKVHTRIHTGERPFKCDHCQRTFTQKGDMSKHMLIHLGPTPHKCSECNASFRLETELRKHSYSHFKPPEN